MKVEAESVKLDKRVLDEVRKIAKKESRTLSAQLKLFVVIAMNLYRNREDRNDS